MSLLQKASIITTPTAYAEDFLYNIKPAGGLGDELVTNGDYTNGLTGWSTQIPSGQSVTVTNNQLRINYDHTATQGSTGVNQTILTAGRTYQIVVEVISITGTLRIQAGGQTEDITTVGIHTFIKKPTSTILYVVRQSNAASLDVTINSISVKEIVDFDFDRNSTGTRVNEDYLIEDVPYNLAKYSQDLSGGAWSNTNSTESLDTSILAPDGTATAWKLQASAATGFSFILQAITMTGQNTFSCFLKKGTSSTASMFFSESGNFGLSVNLDTGTITNTGGSDMTSSVESAGNGWYRFHISHTSGDDLVNQIRIGVADGAIAGATYAGTENIYVWGAQVTKGGIKDYLKTTDRLDIPRIDYTNGEPSILLEPSSTNLFDYSEDFSQWENIRTTDALSSISSPSNINNVYKIIPSVDNNNHRIDKQLTLTNGNTYSLSFFAKSGEYNCIQAAIGKTEVTGNFVSFNLDTGVKTESGTISNSSITEFPNGWYRCSLTAAAGTTDRVVIGIGNNDVYSFVGDASSGLYLWGAMIEEKAFSTSYIPTSGNTVTRSADAANNAGNSDLINSTEGVLYAEVAALANDGTNRAISISDGTTSNVVRFYYSTTDNRIVGNVKSGGSSVFNFNNVLVNATDSIKLAIYYKLNDFKMYVNGTQVSSDTSGAAPTGLRELAFDNGAGNDEFYGEAQMVAVFKEALTDLELAKLTGYNNHELYMNYYNRLSYLGLVEEYNVESDINNYIL